MKPRIAKIITVRCIALVSCFVSGIALAENAAEKRDDYNSTGEFRRCLTPSSINSITALDDRTLLFRVGPSTHYRSVVSKGCSSATSPFRRIQLNIRSGSICAGEQISVVDNSDNITTGFCRLGEFERVIPNH